MGSLRPPDWHVVGTASWDRATVGSVLTLGVEPWDARLASEGPRTTRCWEGAADPPFHGPLLAEAVTEVWPGRVRGHTQPPPGGEILSQPPLEQTASCSRDTVTWLSAAGHR